MIHSGSRGFGHQVATDALLSMEKAMKRDKIETNDRQLACARIHSQVSWIDTLTSINAHGQLKISFGLRSRGLSKSLCIGRSRLLKSYGRRC